MSFYCVVSIFLFLYFPWSPLASHNHSSTFLCIFTQPTILSSIPSLWICHYDFLTREDPRRTGPHQRFSGPFNQRSGIFPFLLVNGYGYFFLLCNGYALFWLNSYFEFLVCLDDFGGSQLGLHVKVSKFMLWAWFVFNQLLILLICFLGWKC